MGMEYDPKVLKHIKRSAKKAASSTAYGGKVITRKIDDEYVRPPTPKMTKKRNFGWDKTR